ncbi:MAG: hypothetical protein ABEJ65_09090 [bacterium]
MVDESDQNQDQSSDVDISRRKFLKWAAYTPPAMMAVMASSTAAEAATCGPDSCNPNTCGPDSDDCNPNTCGPDRGCNPDDGCNPPGN